MTQLYPDRPLARKILSISIAFALGALFTSFIHWTIESQNWLNNKSHGFVDGDLSRTETLVGAIVYSDIATVAATLALGQDPNEALANGDRPLHLAASLGNLDVVSALLLAGADVLIEDGGGFTPIELALEFGNRDAARLLLEGIRIDAGSIKTSTLDRVAHALLTADEIDLLKKIAPDLAEKREAEIARQHTERALLLAVMGGDEKAFRQVLARKPSMSATDQNGWTALWVCPDSVDTLLMPWG